MSAAARVQRQRETNPPPPTLVPAAETGYLDGPDTPLASFLNVSVPSSIPAPLYGSHQILVHQNIIADVEGLPRIQDEAQLKEMVQSGSLVALPTSAGIAVDPRLASNRRYCRRWTAEFLRDLTRAHERFFGDPLVVTSAVRTVSFQRRLARYNGNAAPTHGDIASPHLTGQTIDIGKKGMSSREIGWMRSVLGQLQASGKLDVEEEFRQACFHISVYKTYMAHQGTPTQLVASNNLSPTEADALAADVMPDTLATEDAHSKPVTTRSRERRHRRSYEARRTRRVGIRHRRRHHQSMSLLAAGLR